MLLLISLVVAVCSSAAVAIWLIWVATSSICCRIPLIEAPEREDSFLPSSTFCTLSSMVSTAALVSLWIVLIMLPISCVAFVVRSASARTSSATTANPRPCSPALAASMAALSASRLVWSAMSSMVPMISPIWSERSPSVSMVVEVAFTLSAMRFIMAAVPSTTVAPFMAWLLAWREASAAMPQLAAMSLEVADISSPAVATVVACDATCSAPVAIASELLYTCDAAVAIRPEVAATRLIILATSSDMVLKAAPTRPISSLPIPSMRAVRTPLAMRPAASSSLPLERVMLRMTKKATSAANPTVATSNSVATTTERM